MTASALITNHIPSLHQSDTVRFALDLMQEHRIAELPLLDINQKYSGLVHEEDMEEADESKTVEQFLQPGKPLQVTGDAFFLVPLKIMQQHKLSLLPVVTEEGELTGVITREELLHAASQYNSASVPGGIIILQMSPNSFYISEIGRIVESNNAKIIHLNTWTDASAGELMVAIKVNKSDILDILASFERYQYNVIQYFGENLSEEELKVNYDHLMNYLNI